MNKMNTWLLVSFTSLGVINGCSGGGSGNTATNKPPIAKALAIPATAFEGEVIRFDGSQSRDEDGDIVQYIWKEDGNTLSMTQTFSLKDMKTGTHTITLTVTDNDGASSQKSIQVVIRSLAMRGHTRKTGQTVSYDNEGNEVQGDRLKDDGYYQKGLDPVFTRDDSTGIVTDHLTGLQWQDNGGGLVQKKWLTDANYQKCTGQYGQTQESAACLDTSGDTAATYCRTLSLDGGQWRLPTIQELISITDTFKHDPAIHPIFQSVTSTPYVFWSSTPYQGDQSEAWGLNTRLGRDEIVIKGLYHCIRCVRSAP